MTRRRRGRTRRDTTWEPVTFMSEESIAEYRREEQAWRDFLHHENVDHVPPVRWWERVLLTVVRWVS